MIYVGFPGSVAIFTHAILDVAAMSQLKAKRHMATISQNGHPKILKIGGMARACMIFDAICSKKELLIHVHHGVHLTAYQKEHLLPQKHLKT